MSGRVFSSVGAEFTLSWDPPSNTGMVVGGVTYSVDGGACGSPVDVSGTSATFAKPPDNRVCSIQVTATNGRCNFTSAPLVTDITFEGQHSVHCVCYIAVRVRTRLSILIHNSKFVVTVTVQSLTSQTLLLWMSQFLNWRVLPVQLYLGLLW